MCWRAMSLRPRCGAQIDVSASHVVSDKLRGVSDTLRLLLVRDAASPPPRLIGAKEQKKRKRLPPVPLRARKYVPNTEVSEAVEKGDICVLCLQTVLNGEPYEQAPCIHGKHHAYHTKCLRTYKKHEATKSSGPLKCPQCKSLWEGWFPFRGTVEARSLDLLSAQHCLLRALRQMRGSMDDPTSWVPVLDCVTSLPPEIKTAAFWSSRTRTVLGQSYSPMTILASSLESIRICDPKDRLTNYAIFQNLLGQGAWKAANWLEDYELYGRRVQITPLMFACTYNCVYALSITDHFDPDEWRATWSVFEVPFNPTATPPPPRDAMYYALQNQNYKARRQLVECFVNNGYTMTSDTIITTAIQAVRAVPGRVTSDDNLYILERLLMSSTKEDRVDYLNVLLETKLFVNHMEPKVWCLIKKVWVAEIGLEGILRALHLVILSDTKGVTSMSTLEDLIATTDPTVVFLDDCEFLSQLIRESFEAFDPGKLPTLCSFFQALCKRFTMLPARSHAELAKACAEHQCGAGLARYLASNKGVTYAPPPPSQDSVVAIIDQADPPSGRDWVWPTLGYF